MDLQVVGSVVFSVVAVVDSFAVVEVVGSRNPKLEQ